MKVEREKESKVRRSKSIKVKSETERTAAWGVQVLESRMNTVK